MKIYQFIGTRNKADFVIYLAHAISTLEKRILIVDQTTNEWYRHGYVRLPENEHLYDLQGIDILCGTQNWLDVEECLRRVGETTSNYDVIMFDIDHVDILQQEWPEFDERFYVGDFEREHIMRDAKMLDAAIKNSGNNSFRHITFTAKYQMNPNFIEVLLKEKIHWNSINYIFESSEETDEMRLTIQHEQTVPYKKLNKQYKDLFAGLVAELMTVHSDEVKERQRGSFLGGLFTKKPKLEVPEVDEEKTLQVYNFEKIK
jgi:hypothetical protein